MKSDNPKGNTKLAIAYIRVSTDTERQALGAQAQRTAIEQWAQREGVTILDWQVEQVSGGASLDKRPVLLAAIASVAAHGAGYLVTQRVDRFSRDPVSAALAESSLRKCGACLATADGAGSGDDPTSELLRGILLSVARFEKALIRARIVAALAVKKAKGERLGAPRFGERIIDGKAVENPVERATKVRLKELRSSGLKLREVLAQASAEGLKNRVGRPFNMASIHALVRNAG